MEEYQQRISSILGSKMHDLRQVGQPDLLAQLVSDLEKQGLVLRIFCRADLEVLIKLYEMTIDDRWDQWRDEMTVAERERVTSLCEGFGELLRLV